MCDADVNVLSVLRRALAVRQYYLITPARDVTSGRRITHVSFPSSLVRTFVHDIPVLEKPVPPIRIGCLESALSFVRARVAHL